MNKTMFLRPVRCAMGWIMLLLSTQVVFAAGEELKVYKSPDCGCCVKWIEHMEQQGVLAQALHPVNMAAVKQHYGIKPAYRSCHTAVSEQGYVFEGHVPARLVQQFLAAPPAGAIGLTVPGMPVGSPGMEMGTRFDPYQVLLLKQDGSAEVYATISQPSDQY